MPLLALIAARPLSPLYAFPSVMLRWPSPPTSATDRKYAVGTTGVLTKLEITALVGSQIPGVLEADTSTRFGAVGETGKPPQPGPPPYPINVIDFPSIERFSASSDFELKLVTI